MKKSAAILVAASLCCVALLLVAPANSWIPEYTAPAGGGTPQPDHWDFSAFPVQWNLNATAGANITGSRPVADVIQASFNTWTSAPNTALSISRGADISDTSAGFTSGNNNTNLICFVCQGDFSKDAETLAVTITTIENSAGGANGHGGKSRFVGQILDSDILFNPNTKYSTGDGSGQDLQTVATHEIGHFFGLDHTAVVRAMMFPFAPDFEQTLGYDDVAAISTMYPKGAGNAGTISGTIHMAGSGAGIFGAHVFAQSVTDNLPYGANIRKTPISTLSQADGSYSIAGVPPDSYIVAAEPLDDPVGAKDIQDFVNAWAHGSPQTNFTTRWH